MRNRFMQSVASTSGLCALLLAGASVSFGQMVSTEAVNLGLRGVYFVENSGQWLRDDVYFGLKSRGVDVAFGESSFEMHVQRDDARDTLTVSFPGSNPVIPNGAKLRAAKFNYFVGGEGRGVAGGVSSYGEVVYEDLYDGIDLHVMGSDDGVMKYEFRCEPGARWSDIRVQYDGIESLCVDNDGSLQIATEGFGVLRDAAVVVWQDEVCEGVDGAREIDSFCDEFVSGTPLPYGRGSLGELSGRYVVVDAQTYGFAIDGKVDGSRGLVIDPDVEWMVYLGGATGGEGGADVATAEDGSIYLTGRTTSADFEGRLNSYRCCDDAYVAKMNAAGTLQWMTYLGGTSTDSGRGVGVDSAGNAYVAGATASSNFTGAVNDFHGIQDAFAAKIGPSGVVQWVRFLGGDRSDYAWAMTMDSADNVLVAAFTESDDFEGHLNSFQGDADAAVIKVSPTGELLWMTYLGGSGREACYGINTDGGDFAFVTGDTSSTDFVGRINEHHGGDVWDAYVARLNPAGDVEWMSYVGGTDTERGYGVDTDAEGNVYTTGYTSSADFDERSNEIHSETDAFLARLNRDGIVEWSRYLGGSDGDFGTALATDFAGVSYVAGYTYSDDFEGRSNSPRGETDAFAAAVDSANNFLWMQYLGGSAHQRADGVGLGRAGHLLICGSTSSDDFEGQRNTYHGNVDAYIARVRLTGLPELNVAATCPMGGSIEVSWSGATGGGTVALVFARNTGSVVVPQNLVCAGTVLGLGASQIQVAFQGSAGPNGSRTINANAGPAACGGYLQLLDVATCSTSNVVLVE